MDISSTRKYKPGDIVLIDAKLSDKFPDCVGEIIEVGDTIYNVNPFAADDPTPIWIGGSNIEKRICNITQTFAFFMEEQTIQELRKKIHQLNNASGYDELPLPNENRDVLDFGLN
jgi:hypothetical protein